MSVVCQINPSVHLPFILLVSHAFWVADFTASVRWIHYVPRSRLTDSRHRLSPSVFAFDGDESLTCINGG